MRYRVEISNWLPGLQPFLQREGMNKWEAFMWDNVALQISQLICRDYVVFAPSQWKRTLQCNVASRRLPGYSYNWYVGIRDHSEEYWWDSHYIDVIMTTMASQITSLTVVYSTVYSDADQRKHQSSASLAFVGGIHQDRWIPPQRASYAENVSIWWRHHAITKSNGGCRYSSSRKLVKTSGRKYVCFTFFRIFRSFFRKSCRSAHMN